MILAVEKKSVLQLQDPRTVRKTAMLDDHVCLGFAGTSLGLARRARGGRVREDYGVLAGRTVRVATLEAGAGWGGSLSSYSAITSAKPG